MNAYSIARIKKDKSFDGQFYFGVKTTGIFCRPSCPCPIAKEENVVYFDSVIEAFDKGFRPCKRCQPDKFVEHYHKNLDGVELVQKSLKIIDSGFLVDHSLEDLSDYLYISNRHLRQLFADFLGTTPLKVSLFKKVLLAKEALRNTDWSITRVADGSGFSSTRQFNDVFKKYTQMTPSDFRKSKEGLDAICLEIPYEEEFQINHILDFLPHRITRGVEKIEDNIYSRTFRIDSVCGYLEVEDKIGHIELRVYTDKITVLYDIYQRIIGLFDLATDFKPIYEHFKSDDLLLEGLVDGTLPRLPKAFNPFELTIRAIINQQISIKATSTFMHRLVVKAGLSTVAYPDGLDYYFPRSQELYETDISDIGLTNTRQQTISNVVKALMEEQVSLSVNQSFEAFRKSFIQVKGIGDWTINYVALRALGMVDAFPAKDLGVVKALGTKNEKEILTIAEKWRPYRGYATLCLWHRG